MDMEKTYRWQIVEDKKYKQEDLHSLVSFHFTECNVDFLKTFIAPEDYAGFKNQYTGFTISNPSKSRIDSLITEFNLKVNNADFYLLSAFIQYRFINALKTADVDLKPPLMEDFQNERKDFNILLKVLEDYLNGHGNHKLHSILLKGEKPSKISNNFVIRDMLRILSEHYGLTKENFETRSKELLNQKNPTKLKHISDAFKYKISHSLLDYISSVTNTPKKTAKSLHFALSFLHNSQIPLNKEKFEILPPHEKTGNTYDPDELKHFRRFLNQRAPYKI